MDFRVLTIFPEMITPFRDHGIVRRAIEAGQITLSAADIRDYAEGRHHVTDDRPFGGGPGMVMKPEPLVRAIRAAREKMPDAVTVLLSPQGRLLDQNMASALALEKGLIMVCGRYEGVDERICHQDIDAEISIGDYVLTGGELPAMVVIDAVIRMIPGVLGDAESAARDTFSNGLIKHAHYTRPRVFEGHDAPEVLLTGNHAEIEKWRLESSLIRTFLKRPDLLEEKAKHRRFSQCEIDILEKWRLEIKRIIHAQTVCGPDALSGAE